MRSPWVWVEYGQARQRGLRPIPVVSPGTAKSVVPELIEEVVAWVLEAACSRGTAPWLAVLVQAPAGLCGKGEVLALGTWSVPVNERNRAFLTRLERWLRDEP